MVLSDIVKRCMRLVRDTQSRVWSYAAPIVVAATAILYSVGGEVDSQAYEEHRQWSTPAQVVDARASALIEEDLTHNALSLLYGCTNPAVCNFDFYTDCIDLSQLENEWGGPCGYLDDGSCVFPGCTDHQACNFNASDGCDDGSCIYPDNLGVCGGTCFGSDDDGDFILISTDAPIWKHAISMIPPTVLVNTWMPLAFVVGTVGMTSTETLFAMMPTFAPTWMPAITMIRPMHLVCMRTAFFNAGMSVLTPSLKMSSPCKETS